MEKKNKSVENAVDEVMEIIITYAPDIYSKSLSYMKEELYKLGLSTRNTRTEEWNRLLKKKPEDIQIG